ncbi:MULTISPECIES: carboxylating nicotinate-nucleotide diphosphorylase [unclassified Thermoactinomyces]|jgi:nicotinate-nucleotide pyrophosphorylase (carboxylating)|uniref:carboxylating nicotinate-nucleotide diphosphorylase n=1 Tax=unclassified Thermoactinomyces TaxID=2634588 RepID=UPI0018DE89FA|nr:MULTISPECIES: carboxylating nicotinate-nucleotide diphosphorylase [unclassified Thermoactinomyces]MBH8602617.1 carboxylating nicotinate-nucleotide diphosphorylase [Thermoactinomyces sp. CICC 10522]MBH8606271.1 carboxylating nicotinate-nucleotide diphosphorylase [Thermoactinomyces sp. CICC 10521]
MNTVALRQFIREALNEDLGVGDLTTEALVPAGHQSSCVFIAKQPGVIAGLPVAKMVFEELEPQIAWTALVEEGAEVEKGTPVARISGPTSAILTGERVALNLLQRMSGIATITRRLVKKLEGLNCKVLDTRKTTPGLRQLEKYAVRVGGGSNHRFGLSHGVMIKDNHIAMAGSLAKAIEKARNYVGHMVQIEVEADTLDQVKEILKYDVDAILLDNMDLETMREAVRLIDGKVWTEASGGITPETIRAIAETGVDAVSLGWLTHSVTSLDISLDFEKGTGDA